MPTEQPCLGNALSSIKATEAASCQGGRHRFNPWSEKTPLAVEERVSC